MRLQLSRVRSGCGGAYVVDIDYLKECVELGVSRLDPEPLDALAEFFWLDFSVTVVCQRRDTEP